MKHSIAGLMLFFASSAMPDSTFCQEWAAVTNTNMQVYGSLGGKPIAWATTVVEIQLNRVTGDFIAKILIDDFAVALSNPDFMGYTGENKGKYLTLSGVLPINDVVNNNNTVMNLNIAITASFNDIDYPTSFSFSILRVSANNNKGFSVMSRGSLSVSKLQLDNLKQLDDQLDVALSFTGY